VSAFQDHFSAHAADYQTHRPAYPPALFEHLASLAPSRRLAWDAGTGNGQAAVELAKHFERVIATDASAEQVRNAAANSKVDYSVATAEQSPCETASVDLITVAQALHWFAFERFFAEVRRVGRPGFIFAAIGYSGHRVNSAVDAVQDRFECIVGPYWPPERAWLEAGYRTIPFPFREIAAPPFTLTITWSLATYLGYLKTWSSIKPFIAAHGFDPVQKFAPEFAAAWGDPATPRLVTWDLHLRVGS
jgi:SAM-dependent methyltransferase